jgi:carbon monoxide dehydrogenase subunit G
MLKIESSTVINRPVEEVFAVLSNAENNPKWSSAFLEVNKTSEGPIGVGTTWRGVGKFLGKQIEVELEETEYEPNRKSTQKSVVPFPVHQQMAFENVDGGTRLNVRFEADPGGFFKLAEPLLASMAKRNIESELANLKDLMDAHAL